MRLHYLQEDCGGDENAPQVLPTVTCAKVFIVLFFPTTYLYIINKVWFLSILNSPDRPKGPLWGPLGPDAS